MVLVLALSNAFLVYENLDLRAEAAEAYRTRSIRVGDRVEDFSGWTYSGDVVVAYEDPAQSTVFLYLSPDCVFCTGQLPAWRAVVDSLNRARHRVYAIVAASEVPETVRSYLNDAGLGELEVVFVNRSVMVQYGLQYTPTTMIVAGDGTIQKIWTGLWNRDTREEVAQYFNMDPLSF